MAEKNWYVRDEAIADENQDEFSHIDFARELKNKISELGAPLTIALEGKHGTGKSSIASLLREQFKSDPNYLFVSIEAWRHEGESRRKAFLYDVVEHIEGVLSKQGDQERAAELGEIRCNLYVTMAHQTAVLDLTGAKESLKVLWSAVNSRAIRIAGIFSVMGIVAATIFYFWTVGTNPQVAGVALWNGLTTVAVAAATGYVGSLAKTLFEKVLEPARVTVTANAPTSAEQFEQIFRRTLEVALGPRRGKSGKTLVLLIDELDRLSPAEIIEALKAIRTFRDVRPCIFVVALDEEVVKRALIQSRPEMGLGIVRDSDDAEEFLNKFFKLRQHIPLLVSRDMRLFAASIISGPKERRVRAGIAELPDDLRTDLVEVLIHRRVKTPRHVIRLVNSFNGDLRLTQLREGSGLISKDAVTGSVPFLAVMTVLREDYPVFYDDLTRERDLIGALDLLLDGKGIDTVAESFPGYEIVCRKYFASKAKEGENEGGPDYSLPHEDYRDVLLLLRETARFRAPSVVPFLYLREDNTARALGSKLAEDMADEFQANYVNGLRHRIAEGGPSYAQAAVDVALYCLEESKGTQLANTVSAVCELFAELPHAGNPRLADRTVMRLYQLRTTGLHNQINPDHLIEVVAASPDNYYKQGCVQSLIDRIRQSTDNTLDEDIPMFNALVTHPDLVPEGERGVLRKFTAGDKIPLNVVLDWLKFVNEHIATEQIVHEFFGNDFLGAATTLLVSTDSKSLPDGIEGLLHSFAAALSSRALSEWSKDYIDILILMLGAKSERILGIGFDLLQPNIERTSTPQATKAIGRLFAIGYSRKDWMAKELQALLLEFGRIRSTAFDGVSDKSAVNPYFEAILTAEDTQTSHAAHHFLQALVRLINVTFFNELARELGELTETTPSVEERRKAYKAWLLIADSLDAEARQQHITAVAQPVSSVPPTEDATFSADALILAMDSDVVRPFAVVVADGFLQYFTASYEPAQLAQIARVVDVASPYLSDQSRETYLSNLNGYLGSFSEATAGFLLERVSVLEHKALVPESYQTNFADSIIRRWGHVPSESRERASTLLGSWHGSMPADLREKFWQQQVGMVRELASQAGWDNLKSAWPDLPTQLAIEAASAGLMSDTQRADTLRNLATGDLGLEPDEAVTLLTSIQASLDEASYRELANALISQLNDTERNSVSTALFQHLSEQPDPLGNNAILDIAIEYSTVISSESLGFFLPLVAGDSHRREVAIANLETLFNGKTSSSAQKAQLLEPLALPLRSDSPDLARKNLAFADKHGIAGFPEYREALEARQTSSEIQDSAEERELKKRIREVLKRLS